MFNITIYEENNDTWTLDLLFKTYNDAKNYLTNSGYIENNRWFYRQSNGWYQNNKAIISRMRVCKGGI